MKTKPKAPVTLATLQAEADKLRALHALTQSYWEREQIPPESLLDERMKQQAKLAKQLHPLMETLAAAGCLSVMIWTGTFAENLTPDDRRKQKYLGWTAFDVCADGGLELHCFGPCDTNSIPPPTIAELLGNRPTVAQN
jgi:hypothetical protein